MANGFDAERNTFVQSYGRPELDASLLLIPRVGFLPPDDPRVIGTIDADPARAHRGRIRAAVPAGGKRRRPARRRGRVPCLFVLAGGGAPRGRPPAQATELFERLLALRNDVGLLSEEWGVEEGRQLGNTPQAFSHFALVTSALELHEHRVRRSDTAPGVQGRQGLRLPMLPLILGVSKYTY